MKTNNAISNLQFPHSVCGSQTQSPLVPTAEVNLYKRFTNILFQIWFDFLKQLVTVAFLEILLKQKVNSEFAEDVFQLCMNTHFGVQYFSLWLHRPKHFKQWFLSSFYEIVMMNLLLLGQRSISVNFETQSSAVGQKFCCELMLHHSPLFDGQTSLLEYKLHKRSRACSFAVSN